MLDLQAWQACPVLLVQRLRRIGATELRGDLVAGATVTFVLIPQALAYAMLAGVSPVVGLYAASIPTVLYAFLGASRHMAMGPVALTSLLVASGLAGRAVPGTPEYDGLAVALTTMVAVVFFLMSLIRAGVFVNFLSHPTVLGFNAGAALLTAGSQISSYFGIPRAQVPSATATYPWPFFGHLDQAHLPTVLVATAALLALVLLRRYAPKWPGMLMVCVIGTAASAALGLADLQVAVVGDIPRGLPPFAITVPTATQVAELWPTAISIAVVGYGASITVVKALATEPEDRVRPNQELFAFGACNLASAAVGAFPVTGALARGTVMSQAGARTQLTGLFAGLGVLATLLFLAPAFEPLPRPVLAAIVVLAASRLINLRALRRAFFVDRLDGLTALVALVTTLAIGPELGLFAGIAASLTFFVARTVRPHSAELGRLPGTLVYRNVDRFEVETCPQAGLLRIDAPLYYANARFLEDRVQAMFVQRPDTQLVVLDFSAVSGMDATAVLALDRILETQRARGHDIRIVGAIGPVRDLMERTGLRDRLGAENLHRTLLEAAPAVMACVSREYCETRCKNAAFPDCSTIPRRSPTADDDDSRPAS